VFSVELVSVASERMDDYPAPWSALMRTPVIEPRVEAPLNEFFLDEPSFEDVQHRPQHLVGRWSTTAGTIAWAAGRFPCPHG
jgi:hypothetical protein